MNSEIILSYLGNALMPDRDNTPLGEDAEKDFQAYHKSHRLHDRDFQNSTKHSTLSGSSSADSISTS